MSSVERDSATISLPPANTKEYNVLSENVARPTIITPFRDDIPVRLKRLWLERCGKLCKGRKKNKGLQQAHHSSQK